MFGHFFIGAEGGTFFRGRVVVQGDETSIESVEGDVSSDAVDGVFNLQTDETTEFVVDASGAVLLDALGDELVETIVSGQEAEAWAQTSVLAGVADPADFPAFLVQVSPGDDEESVIGTLFAVDGDQITLTGEAGEI